MERVAAHVLSIQGFLNYLVHCHSFSLASAHTFMGSCFGAGAGLCEAAAVGAHSRA